MSTTSRAVWFSSKRFFSRDRARKFLPELGLVLKNKWKNINAVFFEIVWLHSQGRPRKENGLPRDRLRRSNGERLEPDLSQTSQNASMRRCHSTFFLFHYPYLEPWFTRKTNTYSLVSLVKPAKALLGRRPILLRDRSLWKQVKIRDARYNHWI